MNLFKLRFPVTKRWENFEKPNSVAYNVMENKIVFYFNWIKLLSSDEGLKNNITLYRNIWNQILKSDRKGFPFTLTNNL